MKTETLNAVLASCAVAATIAACAFVAIKSRNDGSIARDTARIADALQPATARPTKPEPLTVDESNRRWADMNFETERKAREACEKRGKSVIRSAWDSRMVACQ